MPIWLRQRLWGLGDGQGCRHPRSSKNRLIRQAYCGLFAIVSTSKSSPPNSFCNAFSAGGIPCGTARTMWPRS